MKIDGEVAVQIKKQTIAFLKWTALACVVGAAAGGISTGFYFALQFVTSFRIAHGWILWLLPAGGAAIVLFYRLCGVEHDKGTNLVLVAVRENADLPLKMTPLVFLSTLITHLFGGSAGREGAVLQIGGSVSSSIGRVLHLNSNDSRIITMCGMSAAFAALFGTPLTSAIFAMEVISVGVMYYAAFFPCVLSAVVAAYVAKCFGAVPTHFSVGAFPALTPLPVLKVVALSVLFAALSILFCRIMRLAQKIFSRSLPNPWLRIAVGGFLVILMTYLSGTRDYNGSGGPVIAAAIAGKARPEAFILKLLFTAVTLGAGYKGGEIVPAFFCGATFGCAAAPLFALNPAFGAALGLVAVFCGVTNCPMTSLVLSYELFGASGMPFFALSCAVSYMLSGYYGLYPEQKILYSKLNPVFINRKAE